LIHNFDYTKNDIINSLLKVGLEKNDNVFIHSNLGFFGKLENANKSAEYCAIFKESIFEIIGDEGTLVVPTFSYSYCNNQVFDPKKNSSVCGIFPEFIRNDTSSKRSLDANFSIAAIGKNINYFTENCTTHSFDKNSFWERFLSKNGKFCNFNFDSGSTFLHYVEKLLKVPYRYDKKFSGKSIVNNTVIENSFIHFVYDKSNPNHEPNFEKFHKKACEKKMVKISNLGKGQVICISAKDTLDIIFEEIKTEPDFLIKGTID